MKTIYECEYCGERYDNYDECKKCEEMHKTFTDDLDSVLKPLFTYQKRSCLPESAVLTVDLGEYDVTKKEYTHKYVLGEYKLVRKLSDELQAELIAKYEYENEETRKRWESYRLNDAKE